MQSPTTCRLLALPRDAILKILYYLDVKDLLAVELSSRILRDVVNTRHLWLVLLSTLDQACAPDLHPSVDIYKLTTADIRSFVLNAIRSYDACTRSASISTSNASESPSPSDPKRKCNYRLDRTIMPFGDAINIVRGPQDMSTTAQYEIENAKLSPKGRFLFFVHATNLTDRFSWFKTFKILDLHNNNKCIWAYSPCDELALEDPSFVDFDDFACEVAPDGSLLLILRVYDLWVGQREVRSVCKVVHLTPDPEDDTFCCHTIHYSRAEGIHRDFGMSITEKYAMIIDFGKLKVISWENSTDSKGTLSFANARSCTLNLERGHYQEFRIIQDHLLFADDEGNLCAILIPDAFAAFPKPNAVASIEVDLEDLPISRLHITNSEAIIKFAAYQPPSPLSSKPTSPVLLSILTFTEREDDLRLICTCVQATFDPILDGNYKWRLTRTSIPQEVPFNYLTSYSNMTHHGRVLVVTGEPAYRQASLGVITKDGEAVPVELSGDVRNMFKEASNFEYPFVEELSGRIVIARSDEEKRTRVDIFVLDLE